MVIFTAVLFPLNESYKRSNVDEREHSVKTGEHATYTEGEANTGGVEGSTINSSVNHHFG
jgi:hypothetical protein